MPSTPSRKTCFHLYPYFTGEYSYLFACPTYINKRGCVKRVSPCCDSRYKSVLLPFSLSSCQPRLESTSSLCLPSPLVVFQHGSSVIGSVFADRKFEWWWQTLTYLRGRRWVAPKAIWHGAGNSPCRPVCSIWFPEFDSVVPAVGVLFFSCHVRPCAYLIRSVSFKVMTRGLDSRSLISLTHSQAPFYLFGGWPPLSRLLS